MQFQIPFISLPKLNSLRLNLLRRSQLRRSLPIRNLSRVKVSWITVPLILSTAITGCSVSDTEQVKEKNNKRQEQAIEVYQAKDLLPVRSDLSTYNLANGLKVILLPRKNSGVELRLLVKSGSLQETEEQRGLAHFVEHMAFKGTRHFPDGNSFKALEAEGLTLGSHINAATSFNSTIYRLSLPDGDTRRTELGLQVLSDWASELNFDPAAFEAEREVIVEEWRLRQGSGYRINSALQDLRYEGSRFADRDAIGKIEVIRNASVTLAKAYYEKWYQPQRMTLVVTGDFDSDDIRGDIADYFADKKRGTTPTDPTDWHRFTDHHELNTRLILDAEQSRRIMQFSLQRNLSMPLNTVNGQWRDLLDTIWLSILDKRLSILADHEELKQAKINRHTSVLDNHRVQTLLIAKPTGNDYAGTFDILAREFQRLATEPVSQAELDSVTDAMVKKLSQQAENERSYENSYLADQLVNAESSQMPMLDKRLQLEMTIPWLESITPAHLQAAVADTLSSASPKLALIGPDTDATDVQADSFTKLWQEARNSKPGQFTLAAPKLSLAVTPPPAGHIVEQKTLTGLEQYQHQRRLKNGSENRRQNGARSESWRLDNGLTVLVHADPDLQGDVQLDLRIKGGNSLDNDDQLGAVNWALNLAESCGYSQYTGRQLSQLSVQNEVSVTPYSQLLYHGLRGSAPTAKMDPLLRILYLKLTAARTCDDKLAQMKDDFYLNQSKLPAERLFFDAITADAFSHSERILTKLDGPWLHFTAPQLQELRTRLFSDPAQMVLTISGPLDPKQLKPQVEQWLGGIQKTVSSTQVNSTGWIDRGIRPQAQQKDQRFSTGTSPKSMVQIHYSATSEWSLERQLALQLVDQMTNFRLRNKVRVEASGVYVINMSSLLARDPAPYYLSRLNFTSAPQRADELATLADGVIQKIATKGFSFAELKQAKKGWQLSHSQMEKGSYYWTQALSQTAMSNTAMSDQNFDELTTANTIVENLTIEQVNEIASALMGQYRKTYILAPKEPKKDKV